jgi:hypothetical protein
LEKNLIGFVVHEPPPLSAFCFANFLISR